MTVGRLSVIGVGPGDPELITLKAARRIREADVVAYPTTAGGNAAAREIAAAHLGHQSELAFEVPMASERAPAATAYDGACRQIAAALEAGRDVALLCEGDPFFYGSAMYLFARLAQRFPVEVIPGVSSLTACAAVAGRPLAARDDVLKVLPATLSEEDLVQSLAGCRSAVIIKVGRHFAKVRRALAKSDQLQAAMIVEAATRPDQRISRVAELGDDAQPYFSTILVTPHVQSFGGARDL